jgi:hypothetical protein
VERTGAGPKSVDEMGIDELVDLLAKLKIENGGRQALVSFIKQKLVLHQLYCFSFSCSKPFFLLCIGVMFTQKPE